MMRVHTKALALSVGIVCGALIFLKTLVCVFTGYGEACLSMLSALYPGYGISVIGSIIGLVYGFLSGGIIAGTTGWLYNKLFVRL